MTKTEQLVTSITKGIQEKKGQDIVIIDLRRTDGAIASYFVICQGNSPTQVEAIAESVAETARKETSEKPANVNGPGNSQWVAIDYIAVIVHIFLPATRPYYAIEDLWEDADQTNLPNID